MDLFKRRCAHRILGPLEQCDLCVASKRAAALSIAGPEANPLTERRMAQIDLERAAQASPPPRLPFDTIPKNVLVPGETAPPLADDEASKGPSTTPAPQERVRKMLGESYKRECGVSGWTMRWDFLFDSLEFSAPGAPTVSIPCTTSDRLAKELVALDASGYTCTHITGMMEGAPSLFVAYSAPTGEIRTSQDGVTWTQRTPAPAAESEVRYADYARNAVTSTPSGLVPGLNSGPGSAHRDRQTGRTTRQLVGAICRAVEGHGVHYVVHSKEHALYVHNLGKKLLSNHELVPRGCLVKTGIFGDHLGWGIGRGGVVIHVVRSQEESDQQRRVWRGMVVIDHAWQESVRQARAAKSHAAEREFKVQNGEVTMWTKPTPARQSNESPRQRVLRLLADTFARETGGGSGGWEHCILADQYELRNDTKVLALKLDAQLVDELARECEEIEGVERATGRKLVRFEGVRSGHPEAVYE